jgi:hypothetical protein
MPAKHYAPLAVLLLMGVGCSAQTKKPEYRFWEPSAADVERAVAVAREHARTKLHVDEQRLARMKSDAYGDYDDGGRRRINLQFCDPEVFPDWKGSPMLGGFPAYFCVCVDADSMRVIHDYASPE